MRKFFLLILILILSLAYFFIFQPNPKEQIQTAQEKEEFPIVSIKSSHIFDFSKNKILFLSILSNKNQTYFSCSDFPFTRKITILDYPVLPGIKDDIKEIVKKKLESCSFSVEISKKAKEDSLIISLSGALPDQLVNQSVNYSKKAIVLSLFENKQINSDGTLQEINLSNFSSDFFFVNYSLKNYSESIEKIVFLALSYGKAQKLNSSEIFLESNQTAFCRVFYFEKDECRFFDSEKISSPEGHLIGPQELSADQIGEFEFIFGKTYEIGKELSLFAVLYEKEKEIARKNISSGIIFQGFSAKFDLKFEKPGDYFVFVVDQFARVHAKAYVKVSGLSARQISKSGNRYEYFLEFSQKPVDGKVKARINSGEWKNYTAKNGTLVIWAAPKEKNSTLWLEFNGAKTSLPIEGESENLFISYLRLYIPAILFLAIIFLLAGVSKKEKYVIYFPHVAKASGKILQIDKKEILQSCDLADKKIGGFGLALRLEEIASALLEITKNKEGKANLYSVKKILENLKEEGLIIQSENYYFPKSFAKGFSEDEIRIFRILHDFLLERGIPFKKKRIIQLGNIILQVFQNKKEIFLSKNYTTVLIFADEEKLEQFKQELEEFEKENIRLKIAISNGKLLLIVASKENLEKLMI